MPSCGGDGVDNENYKGLHTAPTGKFISKEKTTMLVYKDMRLRDFNFWAGAISRAETLTLKQLDAVEAILEDTYPNGIDETQLNDFFWHEEDTIAQWLGFDTFDDLTTS